jgi:hypothetical protein
MIPHIVACQHFGISALQQALVSEALPRGQNRMRGLPPRSKTKASRPNKPEVLTC